MESTCNIRQALFTTCASGLQKQFKIINSKNKGREREKEGKRGRGQQGQLSILARQVLVATCVN